MRRFALSIIAAGILSAGLFMGCRSGETDSPAGIPQGKGPPLECAYYPDYDKSLLFVWIDDYERGGLTGELFDGDICIYKGEPDGN